MLLVRDKQTMWICGFGETGFIFRGSLHKFESDPASITKNGQMLQTQSAPKPDNTRRSTAFTHVCLSAWVNVWRACASASSGVRPWLCSRAGASGGSGTNVRRDATSYKEVGNGCRFSSLQLDAPEEAGKEVDSEQHNGEEPANLEQAGPNYDDGKVFNTPASGCVSWDSAQN